MADSVLQASTDARQPVSFSFKKEHGEFFVLYLKTLLLTVVTLGIYSFWGRVAITKYLYRHTSFGKQSFDYHATGKEMFIGFLKGLGILLGAGAVIFGIIKAFPVMYIPIIIAVYVGGGLFLMPYVVIGKWRFFLSRSSYCNVRFRHYGEYRKFRSVWIKGVLLSMVTLGFYGPVFQNNLQKFFTDNSRFGTLDFRYSGSGEEYFFLWIKGVVLTLLTLGIYSFWFSASINRYILSHTTLNGRTLGSTMTGGGLFKVSISNFFIVIFTLTFGFPIAVNRMYHYFFTNTTLDASPDDLATAAASMDTGASAFASGIEEAANVLDAVSGVF